MAEGRGSNNLRLYIMTLAFTLVFPVLGYTFTNFPDGMGVYDISLSAESLMLAGITLDDAESHGLTYGGGFQYYEISNKTYRSAWDEDWRDPWITPIGDGVVIEQHGIFQFWDPDKVELKSYQTGTVSKVISNSSIVNEYDINYNWTRYITGAGLNVLITPFVRGESITTAVYSTAHLNVTIGTTLVESSTFNFSKFVNWYFSLLVGSASFGLPSVFSWLIKIISAITVLSSVLLAKELISL